MSGASNWDPDALLPEAGRQAHLGGKIVVVPMEHVPDLPARTLVIEQVDALLVA